ncbi:MAG: serine/threonine-protein kinase, partial [Planctomycetota bacterium]
MRTLEVDKKRRVEQILGEWRLAREQGVAASPEEVVRQHPELSDALRNAFFVIDALDEVLVDEHPAQAPAPERLGAYLVDREIGRGGMGTVYLARDGGDADDPGGSVALKVVHPHLMERQGFFKRFLREAEMGRRLNHVNVVRTLEADAVKVEGETFLFLVMEYVEGRTLRELLRDLGSAPEALLLEIARQTATGLAAIHAAGIVHRDLKPENVLITDDHRVRIMDLGVARPLEDLDALTHEGQFAGSLVYAAPEQFGRGELGPAADLYALGVLLYELATGDNPFRHEAPAEVMRAHLDLTPPPACERNPEVSDFLSEVLAELLEKVPDERFASAEALLEVLEEGERSRWWLERERAPRRDEVPRVPVRRETRLYGREMDLEILKQAWAEARSGDGNVLLVEGEAGIGKSRLVDALLQEIRGDGACVLYGSYPPSGGLGGLADGIIE